MKITSKDRWNECQTPDTFTQANPTQDLWYTVLNITQPGTLEHIAFNVDTADESLEVRVTCDGVAKLTQRAATAGTIYYYMVNPASVTIDSNTATVSTTQGRSFIRRFLYQCLIEVRKTTALGAGDIDVITHYDLLKERP